MIPIALYLREFPEHSRLIGDILLGFGDLETHLLQITSFPMGRDVNATVRVLFRLRGAEDRLLVADALVRPYMSKLKLLGPYTQWYGAMRRCKLIRNQYAHCVWHNERGRLWLSSLTDVARSVEGRASMDFVPIDMPILEEQHSFFDYTVDLSRYLEAEAEFRRDRRRRHKLTLPKSRAVPNLDSRQPK